jgi:serine O-acetyltransferase
MAKILRSSSSAFNSVRCAGRRLPHLFLPPSQLMHRRGLTNGHVSAAETWETLHAQAESKVKDPTFERYGLGAFLRHEVLQHDSLASGMSHLIAQKLRANGSCGNVDFEAALKHAFDEDPALAEYVAADLNRFLVVDPAVENILGVYVFYKGFQAITCARVAHQFWKEPSFRSGEGGGGGHHGLVSGKMLARLLQSEMADVYGVDIHPAASFGKGVTIDHATGVVIGETTKVGDGTHIMHDVTLGATGTSPDP